MALTMKTPSKPAKHLLGQDGEHKGVTQLFEQLGIKQDELPAYEEPEKFAKRFHRCDRQEYVHTKYAVTTSVCE